ncbi:MAG: dehydratase [Tardiphaga sp.]|jgi:acyl dehydratase|nr:dehydratase [Tardiphaga sp.]
MTDISSATGLAKPFDPTKHRVVEPRFFEDLKIGEKFCLPSRTVTDANFAAFQAVSGDNHPIHYDVEYCRRQGHPGLLAHGLQVLCFTAAGAGLFPHVIGDALLGFIEQSSKFLKPVYVDDTLYPALTITSLSPQRTTGIVAVASSVHNQRGELVLSGEQKYLVRMRSAVDGGSRPSGAA